MEFFFQVDEEIANQTGDKKHEIDEETDPSSQCSQIIGVYIGDNGKTDEKNDQKQNIQ
jgi:hypothetical protein